MKRVKDRKARNIINVWMRQERKTFYRTAHDGHKSRLRTFRKALGF